MAQPSSKLPSTTPEPLPPLVYLPPIVRDPVPVVPVEPPIVNTYLPDPVVLNYLAEPPAPRELSIVAGRRGDPEPYVFGRCICNPVLIAADDSAEWLTLDLLWSVGEIDYFEGLFVDRVFEGRADMLGNMQHFEGGTGQVASSIMSALKGSYDTLAGKAHSVLRWRSEYVTLQIQGWVRGLLLNDPRISPQLVYSTNPALALARVLVDCGYTMNWTSVGTAADYCDELLGSPAQKRWEIGGQIDKRGTAREWISTLALYANCFVDLIGSEVYLIPDKPRASNHTVTADDMILDTIRISHPGGRDVPSAVTVVGQQFTGNLITGAFTDGPVSYTYGTSNGAGTVTELQMPFFQTVGCCGRMAEQIYRKAHNAMTLDFVGFDDGLQRTIGDVGSITNAAFDLSSELMTLIENEQISRGRWRRKYVQYTASNYSDVIYSATENDTSLTSPHYPVAGPQPSVVEETYTPYAAEWNTSYTYNRRFVVTWTGDAWPYLKDYYVTIEKGGVVVQAEYVPYIPQAGSPLAEQTHTLYSNFQLEEGALYTVSVYVRSNTFALSETPGVAYIVASVLFYSADNGTRGLAFNDWTDPGNAIIDDGTNATYAEMLWENDEENESEYLEFTSSLADNAVPDGATITGISVVLRIASNDFYTPESVNAFFVAGATSPVVTGSSKNIATPGGDLGLYYLYDFAGDLTYWGLTNAQAMQLFDDSGNGMLRIVAEVADTLDIPSPGDQKLRVDWVKVGVTFTL